MMPDFSAANFRKTFEFTEKTKGELRQLLRPYYILNLCLAFSFLFVKLTRPFCEILFAPGPVSRNNFEIHHQIFSCIRRHVSWTWGRLRSCSSCWWWSWSGPGRLATSPWSTICPVGSCTPSVLISSSSSWQIQGIDQSQLSSNIIDQSHLIIQTGSRLCSHVPAPRSSSSWTNIQGTRKYCLLQVSIIRC